MGTTEPSPCPRIVSKETPYKQGIAFQFSTKPLFKGNLLIGNVLLTPPKRKFLSYIAAEDVFVNGDLIMEIQATEGTIYFSNASSFYEDCIGPIETLCNVPEEKRRQLQEKCFSSGFSAGTFYGNALWFETISPNHYRCHCNDHILDDDFNDVIIDIIIESGSVTLI